MRITVFGGSGKFIEFLRRTAAGELTCHTSLSELPAESAKEPPEVLFILPRYEEGEDSIAELSPSEFTALIRIIRSKKTKLYIEGYPAYDYRDCFVLGLQARGFISSVGQSNLCLCAPMAQELGFEILQKRRGVFFRSDKHTEKDCEILCEVKNCLGVHKSVCDPPQRDGIALLRTADGIYCSMVDITRLADGEIFSYNHWRDFYAHLFSEILSVSRTTLQQAFEETYKSINTAAHAVKNQPIKEALRVAVGEAVSWHLRSGIIEDEGKGGVYEMIRSFDLQTAQNTRTDSSLISAALFCSAGELFDSEQYRNISRNILDFTLNRRNAQFTDGKNSGLFKWFACEEGEGTHYVYLSDSSRCANALHRIYRITKNAEVGDRLKLAGEGLLRWFDGHKLVRSCAFSYDKGSTEAQKSVTTHRLAPEFYDAVTLLFCNLYFTFNDTRYRDAAFGIAKELALAYPNFENIASHSDSFTLSRLLAVFAAVQRIGSGEWTELIDRLLDYFESRQHSCGGFADGKAYFDKDSVRRDMEFAVGFGDEDGRIADTVYCQNTMLSSLLTLSKCNAQGFDRGKARRMLDSLVKFLLNIQIRHTSPRLDGGWMRAYDMDGGEYYGCDKDFAWGPYCILTGWVSGNIPLCFIDILKDLTDV